MRKISWVRYLAIPLLLIIMGCSENHIPRPTGYLRFNFPKHEYEPVKIGNVATFDKPIYMIMTNKTSPMGEYWFDLQYPHYKTTIHFSYKTVNKNLAALSDDAHYFVYKHTVKASGIDEIPIINHETKNYGIIYRIKGDVASNIQFIVTDSTNHFLRGSLYILSKPNADSLAPIIEFTQRDVEHMLNSIRWE
ncbi:MAG: gliding motility lipoprotein GldD [Salinivirgaceae bacterium]|nr:gliding motility lipoprotein GldD [Salinivirgaceae bacterium]MDD4748202.1 gliding motility lipoprotein GldD [Salinivirgaceae bacterium]MDY0280645.1 gliding motility lipoprotein GldD [Salinivirgaceae bacterium]